MAIGPVEYMVVAFPGNRFKGEIGPALADLVESKTIRVLDLAFVSKDADGNVLALEYEDLDSDAGVAFNTIEEAVGELINEADLIEVGENLDPNTSAAVLVWEDLWATRFADAVRSAGGVLIDIQRIPHEVVKTALDYAGVKD